MKELVVELKEVGVPAAETVSGDSQKGSSVVPSRIRQRARGPEGSRALSREA